MSYYSDEQAMAEIESLQEHFNEHYDKHCDECMRWIRIMTCSICKDEKCLGEYTHHEVPEGFYDREENKPF